jgi:hypothetical protein
MRTLTTENAYLRDIQAFIRRMLWYHHRLISDPGAAHCSLELQRE